MKTHKAPESEVDALAETKMLLQHCTHHRAVTAALVSSVIRFVCCTNTQPPSLARSQCHLPRQLRFLAALAQSPSGPTAQLAARAISPTKLAPCKQGAGEAGQSGPSIRAASSASDAALAPVPGARKGLDAKVGPTSLGRPERPPCQGTAPSAQWPLTEGQTRRMTEDHRLNRT